MRRLPIVLLLMVALPLLVPAASADPLSPVLGPKCHKHQNNQYHCTYTRLLPFSYCSYDYDGRPGQGNKYNEECHFVVPA